MRYLGIEFVLLWGMRAILQKSLILSLMLVAAIATAQPIDRNTVLFGYEATFQDQGMVDEPGRMTTITPHKQAKFLDMLGHVIANYKKFGAPKLSNFNHPGYKPGVKISFKDSWNLIGNMEPVCVEWNMDPVHIDELYAAWLPIYDAAEKTKLVPYVNPAAERSGMGHFHIGGETIAESPFFKHPLLLRNIMVLFHKHPSLLWGFAEAYDIGRASNIESYHDQARQEKFQRGIYMFDRWYKSAGQRARVDSTFQLLSFFRRTITDFDEHYRFINLQHVGSLFNGNMKSKGPLKGKYTVEFRNIRPMKSPLHVQAMAELLLAIMQKMAEPGHIEPFEYISDEQYRNFHSVSVVAQDWIHVKKKLNLIEHPLWDEMIDEYVNNLDSQKIAHEEIKNLYFVPAYSEKYLKDDFAEIRYKDAAATKLKVKIGSNVYPLQKIEGTDQFSAVIDLRDLKVNLEGLSKRSNIKVITDSATECSDLLDKSA